MTNTFHIGESVALISGGTRFSGRHGVVMKVPKDGNTRQFQYMVASTDENGEAFPFFAYDWELEKYTESVKRKAEVVT